MTDRTHLVVAERSTFRARRWLVRCCQALLASLAINGSASASAVIPLDTIPADPSAIGAAYTVSASFEWQDIAIPFHVSAPGYVTGVETGITVNSGLNPLVVGIATSLPTRLYAADGVLSAVCGSAGPPDALGYCQQSAAGMGYDNPVVLAAGEFFSWSGSRFLDAGDYWLFAGPSLDDVYGAHWLSNNSMLAGDWAARSCRLSNAQGQQCIYDQTTWSLVSQYGPQINLGGAIGPGGSYATPTARITFAPGYRVPEPSTLILMLAILTVAFIISEKARAPSIRA